jgi:hypothetical protein
MEFEIFLIESNEKLQRDQKLGSTHPVYCQFIGFDVKEELK